VSSSSIQKNAISLKSPTTQAKAAIIHSNKPQVQKRSTPVTKVRMTKFDQRPLAHTRRAFTIQHNSDVNEHFFVPDLFQESAAFKKCCHPVSAVHRSGTQQKGVVALGQHSNTHSQSASVMSQKSSTHSRGPSATIQAHSPVNNASLAKRKSASTQHNGKISPVEMKQRPMSSPSKMPAKMESSNNKSKDDIENEKIMKFLNEMKDIEKRSNEVTASSMNIMRFLTEMNTIGARGKNVTKTMSAPNSATSPTQKIHRVLTIKQITPTEINTSPKHEMSFAKLQNSTSSSKRNSSPANASAKDNHPALFHSHSRVSTKSTTPPEHFRKH